MSAEELASQKEDWDLDLGVGYTTLSEERVSKQLMGIDK